jgi:NADH:ubiquinone oxidoreductase subunit 6 (subunit J)
MLTHRIGDVEVSNRAVGRAPALVVAAGVFALMATAATQGGWASRPPHELGPTTSGIGEALLTTYVLPFELASVVLLTALIAAVVLSRKEIRD